MAWGSLINVSFYFLSLIMTVVENPDQDELVRLLSQNDGESFSKIYRLLWPSLFNTAYKRLGDKEKCEDIVQNVFVDLWLRKDKISISNLSAYLHTAVRFQVYKYASGMSSNSEFFNVLEQTIDSSFKADENLLSKELYNLVQLWIEALPKKRRKIFLLHYFENLSTGQIAAELNISQKTVQNQLNTATIEIKARFSHLLLLILLLHH
jgi:RNA polymerase sigma-70 factor (family 1)